MPLSTKPIVALEAAGSVEPRFVQRPEDVVVARTA